MEIPRREFFITKKSRFLRKFPRPKEYFASSKRTVFSGCNDKWLMIHVYQKDSRRLTHRPPHKCSGNGFRPEQVETEWLWWAPWLPLSKEKAFQGSCTIFLHWESGQRLPKGEVSGCGIKTDGTPTLCPVTTIGPNVRCSVMLQNFAEKQLQQTWRQKNGLLWGSRWPPLG